MYGGIYNERRECSARPCLTVDFIMQIYRVYVRAGDDKKKIDFSECLFWRV